MNETRNIPPDKIATSEITEKDWQKIRQDLRFISIMSKLAKKKGCRLIVSGGYATDGSLGQITRPHRDIDIQIFGQGGNAVKLVGQLVGETKEGTELDDLEVDDKGRQEFYHSFFVEGNGLGADVYYVQVANDPFSSEKHVIKSDGSHTDRQEYETVKVSLEGVGFEAVSPTFGLVDILYKRDVRGDKPKTKHEQDIANLRLITDAEEVKKRLGLEK